ncbi:MAG: hypothetical protein RBS78_04185, partial [Coriobacteriia bacterium]|nr:hypothetical protein [Coriobacteriia bacterium]
MTGTSARRPHADHGPSLGSDESPPQRTDVRIAMPFIVASVLFGVASVVVLALPLLDGGPVDGRAIAGAVLVWMAGSGVVVGS